MRILLVGGGSGGHVTPLKAVAAELSDKPEVVITVITNRGFKTETEQLFNGFAKIPVKAIFAGKYRRYHSKSLLWHIMHLPTLLKNIRDVLYLIIGVFQSLILVRRLRPDVVFCKGGFVCIPVGLVSKLYGIRLVIHDSDTRPGLTNRILSRWASRIATGMPTSFYPYPKAKMSYIGMPVDSRYKVVDPKKQSIYKKQLGFTAHQPVVLVTGGGNGSTPLNTLISDTAGELLVGGWGIVHLTGRGKLVAVQQKRSSLEKRHQNNWKIEEFADMPPCLLAADIVVARTSASTLQECANAQKAVIGIPSPHLDDQNMNAQYFASKQAIIALSEPELTPKKLLSQIVGLSEAADKQRMAAALHDSFAKPNATRELVALILNQQ